MYIYIYIYIWRQRERKTWLGRHAGTNTLAYYENGRPERNIYYEWKPGGIEQWMCGNRLLV